MTDKTCVRKLTGLQKAGENPPDNPLSPHTSSTTRPASVNGVGRGQSKNRPKVRASRCKIESKWQRVLGSCCIRVY